ncbi:asparagine synthase-related protein [Nostoc sp. DedQUE07]|uniref:asparagine synthase-related protein n=1 Tax=Nostoc sp. DedQUE07 TaxID=3075392 RepID=UPI002AD1F51F|nr:asparagine synthase-related protein [Nostoc sp. DedQUE07]MDZ8131902.1 asparagine synthase-related protein [Nostoc sp. DedQUE07]
MMQRLIGKCNPRRDKDFQVVDYAISPLKFQSIEGFNIPVDCGASFVSSQNGKVCLFTGWSHEIPIYYSIYRDNLYWHEQYLALPRQMRPVLVERGQAVIWHPERGITTYEVEPIPRPPIRSDEVSLDEAVEEYLNLILDAVGNRIKSSIHPVAVSQSGGLDSCLVAWALHTLGIDFVPMVACSSLEDWDYQMAQLVLSQIGIEPMPIVITPQRLPELFDEAVFCYESTQFDNLQMAAANVAIAKQCRELGIKTIFNGHAHDDLMGSEGLVQGKFKQLKGTQSERWRDARRDSMSGFGMEKMFSAVFRRHGIKVQMPFFDTDLANWVFSQTTNIIPVKARKPFARLATRKVLPIGEWSREVYNRHGYITGAGFYEDNIRPAIDEHLEKAKIVFAYIKTQDWRKIASQHDAEPIEGGLN